MNNIYRVYTRNIFRQINRPVLNTSRRKTLCCVSEPEKFGRRTSPYRSVCQPNRLFFTTGAPSLQNMKLETPEFKALFTPELVTLRELFKKYGHEIRIAGGAVRDLLTGKQPDDVDFATTATPDEMKELFEKEGIRMINAKGESHGTITCRINDKENFEVTTLRIDVVTDGRRAQVKFTKDWETDALRRDLTINSMFLDFDGNLYDFFNGKADLEDKKVRFVGDPQSRIQEDYLRILRYFRFFGRIVEDEAAHETHTLTAIRQNVQGVDRVSGERIWMEIKKIMKGRHVVAILKVMIEVGMAPIIGFPDNPNIGELEAVYSRCHDLEPDYMTLLAALLNTEEEVYKLHDRLKLSRHELSSCRFLILHREDDFGNDTFRHCKDIICDTAGKEPQVKQKVAELLKYLNHRDTLSTFNSWTPPRLPVNGAELLERGVKKGPVMTKTLNALREKWKESNYTYDKEDLLGFIEELKETIK